MSDQQPKRIEPRGMAKGGENGKGVIGVHASELSDAIWSVNEISDIPDSLFVSQA